MPDIKDDKMKRFLFIDESGDPTFYGKRKKLLVGQPGFQPILMLGMITLTEKEKIRNKVLDFENQRIGS